MLILFWCILQEYKKPTEVFGFETSQKEYTLAAFGAMADKFKENYFQKAVGVSKAEKNHMVACVHIEILSHVFNNSTASVGCMVNISIITCVVLLVLFPVCMYKLLAKRLYQHVLFCFFTSGCLL